MNYYLILCIAFFQFSGFAQEEKDHNYYWNGYEQYDAKIAVANCYVRESPSINSQLLDSIQMGKSIKVLNTTEPINGTAKKQNLFRKLHLKNPKRK